MNSNLIKICMAEAVGTFFLVFMGCGAIIVFQIAPDLMPVLAISLVFGGTISVMIYAVGHISGAHFNPAVSIAFWIARHLPFKRMIGYIIGQVFGAIMASALHRVIILQLGLSITDLGITQLGMPMPLWLGFGLEVIFSFLLMFVIISVATDTRAIGEMAGLAIGSTVALCSLVGGPLTGASMNPARSLGPALVSGHMNLIWLYILAPILGAILGALCYEKIRR